jgi:amino-acid N-acetyltransferase
MELEPVAADRARALLAASCLPVDDLTDPAITLIGAFDRGALVGVVGLQACGDAALLRSLAVAVEQRGWGLGTRLVKRVLELAGARPVWLLTTDARDYFLRHGFSVAARDEAPAAIRATTQFASLCPSSAIVMCRG